MSEPKRLERKKEKGLFIEEQRTRYLFDTKVFPNRLLNSCIKETLSLQGREAVVTKLSMVIKLNITIVGTTNVKFF